MGIDEGMTTWEWWVTKTEIERMKLIQRMHKQELGLSDYVPDGMVLIEQDEWSHVQDKLAVTKGVIQRALTEAILKEREACALIADFCGKANYGPKLSSANRAASDIASVIRSRNERPAPTGEAGEDSD